MASAAPAIKERRPAAAEPPLRLKAGPAPTAPARPAVTSSLSASPQAKSFVSSPGDPAEREADQVAKQVMDMPAPPIAARGERSAQRASVAPLPGLPRAASPTGTDSAVAAKVRAAATGGAPLSRKTRAFLEPRFRADFSNVMIHTDPVAVRLATELGARAFTYGRHIFFGAGQYNPESRDGLELLAHELTHTIQQSETIQRKEAETAEAPRVSQRTDRQASRLGVSDVLDYFADAANAIPGYRMFTILIGVNPINMSSVEASAANILRAIVEFLPGGNIITRVLDSYGIFDKVGGWIEGQLKSLGITGSAIRAAINKFLDSLGWRDIFRLGSVWNRAKAIFTDPISKIISFAKGLFFKILEMVQEAVLKPLAALAAQTPFYTLLKAVLGKDPVTGEKFEGGAAEVIGGFMTMIGQDELWQNIQRANAIPRAFAWFKTAIKGLMNLVTSIPTRFIDGLKSLEIMDFVVLPRAFIKIGTVLGSFLADFGSWAIGTVIDLLKIIVEVVAPAVLPYIAKAAGAFNTILRNPIGFVGNLVRAAMQGFRQFATNFLTHLQASLVGWLTGAMAGANIYIPQGLNLREILKFVLSILGLTWQNIRGKLVRATNETTVVALETGFDIVRTLVTEGPAAAWQKIIEVIGNLKQMAIDAIMDFVKSRVVQAAVTRLLSMLSPAGAFIQAIMAIYNTIMFFIERLRQIAAVAASFIDSIAAIASGNIGSAANKVETTMGGLLTLVISFLARIAGLGRVSDAVTNLINRIRAPIDRALDAVVNWIVTQARRLGNLVRSGAQRGVAAARNLIGTIGGRTGVSGGRESHSFWVDTTGARPQLLMRSAQKAMTQHLADFLVRAQALPNPERKTRTVNLINSSAMPKAQLIEAKSAQIAANPLNTAARTTLNGQITALEGQLVAPMTSILDAINEQVPTETSMLALTFNVGPGFTPNDRPEFTRQLTLQAQAIGAMKVSEWRRNRATFLARQVATGGRSGRDPRSRSLQAQERNRVRAILQDMLTQDQGIASGRGLTPYELAFVAQTFASRPTTPVDLRGKAMSPGAAQVAIGTWMTRQAALHSPDQVGGGLASGLTGLGQSNVNSSIGSSWGNGKAVELDTKLNTDLANGCGRGGGRVQESLESLIRMRVTLTI